MEGSSTNGKTKKEDLGEPASAADITAENNENPLAILEKFKKQTELIDTPVVVADPELDITDSEEPQDIKEAILENLQHQNPKLFTNISPLLKILHGRAGGSVEAIKNAITELVEAKKIRIYHNAHDMWGTPYGNDLDGRTLYHSIDNLNVYIKLY